MRNEVVTSQTLAEMAEYYRARAEEYDEWFYRKGRFDQGVELNARWFAESEEVYTALDKLAISGAVLELAPGTGIWTERIVGKASSVTAVDASAEMITINQAKVNDTRVRYVLADLFSWQPSGQYDAVVFGFWLSHVPREKLADFIKMVATTLQPNGKIFFVDSRREPTSTAHDHILPATDKQVMTRRLNDGREFQIVKNFYVPAELAPLFATFGIEIDIRETSTYFIYGIGQRGIRAEKVDML